MLVLDGHSWKPLEYLVRKVTVSKGVRMDAGRLVYSFPTAAVTKYYEPGGLKQRKRILSQSGHGKSEIKVSSGSHPLYALREALPLPLGDSSLPRLVATSLSSLPPSSHGRLLCSCVCYVSSKNICPRFRTQLDDAKGPRPAS